MFKKTISELTDTKHEVTIRVDNRTLKAFQRSARNTGITLIAVAIAGRVANELIERKFGCSTDN